MTIGYKNMVPGDETTKVIPVETLSRDDKAVKNYVDAIRTELALVEAKKKMLLGFLEEEITKCQHHVFTDTDAGVYAFRKCVICGFDMGSV